MAAVAFVQHPCVCCYLTGCSPEASMYPPGSCFPRPGIFLFIMSLPSLSVASFSVTEANGVTHRGPEAVQTGLEASL